MDRLEAMGVLLAAVEAGSLSGAARRLHMPLPTVSRKVADLEAHLKTQLLIRSSRRLALTDAGQAYIAACRRILDEVNEAERAASGEYQVPKGDLIVTAPVAFGRLYVLPIITAFLKAYPEIDVRLVLADRMMSLTEDHVDVALRFGHLSDSSLIAIRLGEMPRVIAGSPAYLAARGLPQKPQDLERHDCISFEAYAPIDAWSFRVDRADVSVPLHPRLVVNTAEAAADAAAAGVGLVRMMAYQVAAGVRSGALRTILQDFELPPVPVHLLHGGGRLLPLKLRAFLDFATPRLKTALAEIVV
ncbi:MAG TPA: LysR family transcriptional regulator [Magnetospirillaceae bacterium]|jgi:DNA-binding transcriptional LysR family regulator